MDVIQNAQLAYGGLAWVRYNEKIWARLAVDAEGKWGELDNDRWMHRMGPAKWSQLGFTASGLPIT